MRKHYVKNQAMAVAMLAAVPVRNKNALMVRCEKAAQRGLSSTNDRK